MRFPSSIFSFKTLRLQPGVPRGLLTAVLLLATFDWTVSRQEWPYVAAARAGLQSHLSEYLALELRLTRLPSPPQIVIYGDSHVMLGFDSVALARELQLPAASVVNLGVSSGDVYDLYLLPKRNPEKLRQPPLVVFGVDIMQFNANYPLTDRFEHFATLRDRLLFEPTPARLAAGFFRTAEKGRLYSKLRYALAGAAWNRLRPTKAAIQDLPETQAGAPTAKELLDEWCDQFAVSTRKLNLFQAKLQRAVANGQKTIIVQMPCPDAFMQELMVNHAPAYARYKAAVRQLSNGPIVFFESASACGLQTSDFADRDHLSPEGAEKFSRFFAGWLKLNHPELIAAAQAGIGPQTTY